MKFVVIDLETTNLDPKKGNILEIGAIIDDTEKPKVPVIDLPRFHCYVLPPRNTGVYIGGPIALAMNATIINNVAAFEKSTREEQDTKIREGKFMYPDSDLVSRFNNFVRNNGIHGSIIAGGKNFASFDRVWLEAMEDWDLKFAHRSLDPAMWFIQDSDTKPPDLATCLKRAGIEGIVTHNALEDAVQTLELIRVGLLRNRIHFTING